MTPEEFRHYVSGEKDGFRRSVNNVLMALIEEGGAIAFVDEFGEVQIKVVED